MDQENKMNKLMQMVMLRPNQIMVQLLSGKQKNFPKWEFKFWNNIVMAEMAHVFKDDFLAKMPTGEDHELDPANISHKPLIKDWQHIVKASSAIIAARESEDIITNFQGLNNLEVACKMWAELKLVFKPEDGLSELSMGLKTFIS